MQFNQGILDKYKKDYLKSIKHLEYSFNKIQSLPTSQQNHNEEILETWESFAARFSRSSDLYITKILRSLAIKEDPGFEGSVKDILNLAETHRTSSINFYVFR